MSPNLLSWLFLLAMAQGLFLSLALAGAQQAGRRTANRLLAALVLVFVLIIGDAWMSVRHLYWQYPHWQHTSIGLSLLIGPLLYLYLGSILHNRHWAGTGWKNSSWWHFAPFVLGLLLWSPYYLQSAQAKRELMQASQGIPWTVSLFALFKVVQFLAYFAASARLVHLARAQRPHEPLVRALARLTSGLGLGAIIVFGLFFAEHFFTSLPVSSDTVGALVLLVFVYSLALVAIRLPVSYQPLPPQAADADVASLSAPPPKARYAATLLDETQRTTYLARLHASMEQEHRYRDGELKLETLAQHLAMTPHELSQLINDACGTNFQDYLNRYRVEAMKTALLDTTNPGANILDLALACGFNSKSALNRAFKKHTGMTPSQFRGEGSE